MHGDGCYEEVADCFYNMLCCSQLLHCMHGLHIVERLCIRKVGNPFVTPTMHNGTTSGYLCG